MVRQPPGLEVVQVRGADDEAGRQRPLGSCPVTYPDPRHGGPFRAGVGDREGDRLGAGVDAHALLLGHPPDGRDELGETAARVEHPVGQVEVTHEVIDRRREVRRGAQEHRRVAEDLLDAAVPEAAGHVRLQRLGEPREKRPRAGHDLPPHQGRVRGEVRVEEPPQCEIVGHAGRVEILLQGRAGPRLERLEQRGGGGPVRADVDRLGLVLEVHAVAGVEADQVELLGGRGAAESEEVVEHLRHEEPRRARVEAEPSGRPATRPAADLLGGLDERDVTALPGE